jgi:divinyl chlorophyllide a 8-vinyl-reductase
MIEPAPMSNAPPRRIFMLGPTGAIGRACVAALVARGHDVVCFVRPRADRTNDMFAGAQVRFGDATDSAALARDGLRGERFDTIVSCMASRTGAPEDAWEVDHRAHAGALAVARDGGIGHFVLLSAICVQKPRLAFQHAKLAFESELIASGMDYSIVRPTAYFKSLSGQIDRLRQGKPFLVFGDGRATACKPISDRDLGAFLADCVDDPARRNKVLPIGGPGPAITPRAQGEHLFALLGKPARFASVPVAMLDAIVWTLAALGTVFAPLRDKAELARIGRYYATESMLVWDEAAGRYDADATPETGRDTLFEHYARLVSGDAGRDRGAHSVF